MGLRSSQHSASTSLHEMAMIPDLILGTAGDDLVYFQLHGICLSAEAVGKEEDE